MSSTEPLGDFTCYVCKGEFTSPLSEAEAAEEYARQFPREAAVNKPHETVCEDCYNKLMGWANSR